MLPSRYLVLSYLFIFIVSCKLNPPTNPDILQEKGKIYVTSNIDSASVVLDGIATGSFTPDTVSAQLGKHSLRLEKKNYTSATIEIEVVKNKINEYNIRMEPVVNVKTVLIEDFSNVSCVPCVTSNLVLENISKQFGDRVVKIKYPTNFPSPNDLFYNSNPAACNGKIKFYNVLFTPTVWIDGTEKPIANDSLEIKGMINKRLGENTEFKISASDTVIGNKYSVQIILETLSLNNININDLYLNTVVIEKKITFAQPPGSNGETEFFDVMRTILPNPNGLQLNNIVPNGKFDFSFNAEIKPEWNVSEITSVIFVQNEKTKEIYQATIIK